MILYGQEFLLRAKEGFKAVTHQVNNLLIACCTSEHNGTIPGTDFVVADVFCVSSPESVLGIYKMIC